MRLRTAICAFLLSVLTLSGCASIHAMLSRESPGTRLLITYGVMKYLEQAPSPTERAARIVSVAREIKSRASAERVSLHALQAAAMVHVNAISSPADRELARGLVLMIGDVIRTHVGNPGDENQWLSGDELVFTREVMDWVIETVSVYVHT